MNNEEDEFKRIEAEALRLNQRKEPTMTTLRQAAQQALECIERLNAHGWILADFEDEVYAAITALKAALEQPEQRKPLTANTILNMMPSGIPAEYDGPLMEFARSVEAAHSIKEGT